MNVSGGRGIGDALNELLDSVPLSGRAIAGQQRIGEDGKVIKLGSLGVALPPDVLKELKSECKSTNLPQGHVVERALRFYFFIRGLNKGSKPVDKRLPNPVIEPPAGAKTDGGTELDW